MLDKNRLKNLLIAAFNEGAEHSDSEAARDRVADKLATAIVDEIKQLHIVYTTGLTAPNGPVAGTITHTVQ